MVDHTHSSLELTWLPGRYAVARLPADAPVPDWANGRAPLLAVTRTSNELSIVVPEERIPRNPADRPSQVENDWRALRVRGPLDFSLIGILARLTGALSEAGVSVFALSTYETDYLLVKEADAPRASEALAQVARLDPPPSE